MAMAGGREAEAEGEEEGGEYCWEGYRLGVLFCFLHCTYALLVGITLPYPYLVEGSSVEVCKIPSQAPSPLV